MHLKVNGQEIAAYPSSFSVNVMDLDDGETTVRTVDGILNRDRVTIKRQIEMAFSALTMSQISALLRSMEGIFFDFYYPDPMDGAYVTKRMYVGNRTASVPVEINSVLYWDGLKLTLTER